VYDRIYGIIVIGVAWYTWYLIALFFIVHTLTKRKEKQYQAALESVVEELKDILIEEEPIVSKNKLTLTDILKREPQYKDYAAVLDLLVELAQKRFDEYKFLVAKSQDETTEANFLQIISNWSEDPELHSEIFKRAVDTNIDMQTLQKRFAQRVWTGQVIPLGDGVRVITDDNTGNLPTGVSPVNSGLEGGEICFIISFIQADNYDEWYKNTFPQSEAEETNE